MPRELDEEHKPTLAVPDLELDVRPPPPPPPAPASPSISSAPGPRSAAPPSAETAGRTLGGGWDDDDDVAALPSLEVAAPPPRAAAPAALADPSPTPAAAPASKRARNSGAPPDARPPLSIDPFEVKALAAFGPEPANIFASVPYAIRVTMRRRELRTAFADVRKALSDAEAKVLDRLAELGALLRPVVESDPALSGLLNPLRSAEQTKQTREAAAASADEAFRGRVGEIDEKLAALDAPIRAAQAEVDGKQHAADEAEALRARHEARRKRVDIEVRSAQQRLANPEISGTERAQAQAVIAQANGERAARAAEEQQASALAQQAAAQVALARKALSELDGKASALRAERTKIEREFSRAGQVRSEGIDAAGKDLRAALIDLGRRAKDQPLNGEPDNTPMRRKDVADAESQVRRLQHELEKHLRAIDAADEPAVKRGLILLGAGVAVLVIAFILWRALRTNPYMTPGK